LKKDGEKELLCWWCQQPISDTTHNCVKCGNSPVYKYSSSINHCLDFIGELENEDNTTVACTVCDNLVFGSAYKCCVSECRFLSHKSCTELSYKINHHLHSDHTLFLKGPGRNHCDACFKSHHNSLFYNWSSCEFQLDIKCANRLPINPNDCHHEFFPIQKPIQFNCEVCGEEIKNIVSSICTLLVHKKCVEIPRVVKIKLHNHFLTLTYSILEIIKHDDLFCRMCYEKVNTKYAIYYCHECRYVAHLKCMKRFRDLYGELYLDGKWFVTSDSMPNEFIGHATHLIKALNQVVDEGPHHEEIEHFNHQQHKLIICYDQVNDDKLYEGCKELIISIPFYSCMQCNFFIHI
jgi:hypothetical protein